MSSPPSHPPGQRSEHRAALLAAASAGMAVFCFYLVALSVGGTLAPLDGELLSLSSNLAGRIPRGAVARASELGALPVAGLLVLIAAVMLAVCRRPAAAVALVLGLLAIFVVVAVIKEEVGRPRPPTLRTSLATDSFPSGHAAYATAWTAIAVTLARLGLSGWPRWLRVAAVAGGIAATAVCGLTRLLLGSTTGPTWSPDGGSAWPSSPSRPRPPPPSRRCGTLSDARSLRPPSHARHPH